MKGIDPKWGALVSVLVAVELAIGHGTVSLTNAIPASWIPVVQAWCNILAFFGSTLAGGMALFSSNATGLLVNNPAPIIPPAVKTALIAALFLPLFLMSGQASAATLPKPALTGNPIADLKTDLRAAGATSVGGAPLTGNPEKDMQALWDKIVTASNTDLTYAAALATSANTASSKVRLQCWQAIIALNQQANGATLKNNDGTAMVKPDPHLFSDAESLAEVIDNLSPQGPLFTACAGAAQLAKTNTLTLINAAVTGAAGIAALPAGVIP